MKFFTNGGIPTEDSHVYVERRCDAAIERMIASMDSDKVICIHGPRQSGKTSLVNSLVGKFEKHSSVISISFDQEFPVDPNSFASEVELLEILLATISDKLGSYDQYLNWLDKIRREERFSSRSATKLFGLYVDGFVAPRAADRILIIFDEFDEITKYTLRWEFLLRALNNHTASSASTKIRFLLVSLVQPIHRLRYQEERRRSKYTFFQSIYLSDFLTKSTVETTEDNEEYEQTVGQLARGLTASPGGIEREAVARILDSTGGQPYLTVKLLSELSARGDWSPQSCDGVVGAFIGRNRWNSGKNADSRDPHFLFAADALNFSGAGQQALECFKKIRNGDNRFRMFGRIPIALRASGLVSFQTKWPIPKSRVISEIYNEDWIRETSSLFLSNRPAANIKSEAGRAVDESKPNVLIMTIGGTIGVDFGPADEELPPADPERFLTENPAIYELANPIVERPFDPKDGADISPPDWELLCQSIVASYDSSIKGVVVMTGTDTLAFAASAVAFALGKTVPFPIVFVGSQARRKRVFGDAIANTLRAVQLACEGDRLRQVVICFNDEVFRAVRADKKDDFRYDGFWSPTEGPIAIFTEEVRYRIAKSELSKGFGAASGGEPRIAFDESILTIAQAPGLNPSIYIDLLRSKKVAGVKIESLGVGNLPTQGYYNFEELMSCCEEMCIPVLISSRYPVQPDLAQFYTPAKKYLESYPSVVMTAKDMAPAAAHTKFMWAISEVKRRYSGRNVNPKAHLAALKEIMATDLVGEIIDPDFNQ